MQIYVHFISKIKGNPAEFPPEKLYYSVSIIELLRLVHYSDDH